MGFNCFSMIEQLGRNEGKLTSENFSHQLDRFYIVALTLVAMLSIAGQFLIQKTIDKQRQDSYLINVAGRQRMLSQKITKLSLMLAMEKGDKQDLLNELEKCFLVWKQFHFSLLNGDKYLHLNKTNEIPEIKEMVIETHPFFLEIEKSIKGILVSTTHSEDSISPYIDNILQNEPLFLLGMDRVVAKYEKKASEKVNFLSRLEFLLVFITLAVLLIEGLFIFRPASIKIRYTINELLSTERRLNESNLGLLKAKNKLRTANESLEFKVKERTIQVEEKNLELKDKNNQLKKINKELDNFVYTASHDLKAPINNIEGLLQAITSEVPEIDRKAGDILKLIYRSIDNFKSILKDLGDVAKAKRQSIGEELSDTEFKIVLEEIKMSINELIKNSEAHIEDDFSSAPKIKFSSKNLRSIMYNLLSNAIKYRSPDRKPIIKISTETAGEFVLLKVSDNGLGISEEDIPKVFQIYKRLHEHVEGTGVGMSILKTIIENSGGKVMVESKVGEGSTFFVYIKTI